MLVTLLGTTRDLNPESLRNAELAMLPTESPLNEVGMDIAELPM